MSSGSAIDDQLWTGDVSAPFQQVRRLRCVT
jgi:hypothetical protein